MNRFEADEFNAVKEFRPQWRFRVGCLVVMLFDTFLLGLQFLVKLREIPLKRRKGKNAAVAVKEESQKTSHEC